MNHTYCIKTVQTVQYCIKYGLLWGSAVAHKIALTPLNVCGVWMISQESIVLYWDTRFYERHISYCGHRLHATALIWVFKSGLYERERATYSERLKPCSIWFQLRQHFQCDWMADFVFSLSLSLCSCYDTASWEPFEQVWPYFFSVVVVDYVFFCHLSPGLASGTISSSRKNNVTLGWFTEDSSAAACRVVQPLCKESGSCTLTDRCASQLMPCGQASAVTGGPR